MLCTVSFSFFSQNTTMDAVKYLPMIKDKLPMAMTLYHTFMPDGAPCHWVKVVSTWSMDHKINALSWSGNSPDLKFNRKPFLKIKNKFKCYETGSHIKNARFHQNVRCKEISVKTCQNLIKSMLNHLKSIIKNK